MQIINSLRLVLILMFVQVSLSSTAQFSVGVGGGFSNQSGFGSKNILGGEAYAKYQFTPNLRVGLHSGIYYRGEYSESIIASTFLPITFSGEYTFSGDKFKPFGGLHLGVLYKDVFYKYQGFYLSIYQFFGFYIAPVLGVDYAVNDKFGVNCSLKYGLALDENYGVDTQEAYAVLTANLGVYFTF